MGTLVKNGVAYVGGSGGTTDYEDLSNKPSINGTSLVGNKTSAELGIITKAVDDLINYYTKSTTYSKSEVDDIVVAIKNSRFEAVSSLPTTNIKTNVIYLVPKSSPETSDVKDEYINLDGTTSGWELIGSTEIDLSNYVTVTALNTALADYTTTANLTTLLAAKQDTIQVSSLPTASADNLGKILEYTGATENGLTHGYFYECVSDGEPTPTYSWTQTNVQPSSGGGGSYTAGSGITITNDEIATDKMTSSDMDDVVTPLPSVASTVKRYNISIARWLRFDLTNKKGLVIKGNTSLKLPNGTYKDYGADTHIDLSEDISVNGADYFVYLDNNEEIHAYTTKQSGKTYIGRFHTLCVNAGTMTMKAPASPSSGVVAGDSYLVKRYREDEDPDFYAFYNKTVSSVSTGSKYDVVTCEHPLSGFSAGDILPESVFCLTWHPKCLVDDAMVYDKDTGICVDVYMQSGTGLNTRSAYNATHTVNREQTNHMEDMRMVGKRLLCDAEFSSAAIGSNETTNITGSSDKTTVGGHVDTANRRMISAIGCEEMCGYLWQWLSDLITASSSGGNSGWNSPDGQSSFGQQYWNPHALLAGSYWSYATYCGSRARNAADVRSDVAAYIGGRGSSRLSRIQ